MDSRILSLVSIALAAACGGSAPSADPALQTAALEGYVYEVDGQTVDRAGIDVRVLETGEIATTDAEGRFAFAGVPAGGVTLEFGSTFISLAHQAGDLDRDRDRDQDQEGDQEGELERVLIEVRLDTTDEPLLLTGEVPALPDEWPRPATASRPAYAPARG